MLSKIKPLYVLIAGPVVMVIISVVCFFTLIRPQYNPQKEGSLAQLTEQANGFQTRAEEQPRWESQLADAVTQLTAARDAYKEMAATKTLPLNVTQTPEYTIRLWFLHLEDFTKLTRGFLSKAPCEVSPRELYLGSPPMPPPPGPGADGFLPLGSAFTLTATGRLEQVWAFMRSLAHFPNCIVRLNSVQLTSAGENQVVATLPINIWMLVEQAGPASEVGAGAVVAAGGGGEEEQQEEEQQEEEQQEEEQQDEESGPEG